ncbi:MAG: RNB domain-containing ribonuclease, partial [Rhodoglobus sp.]|nr:RNB domain-containing ribonuclease [Rhodoglobus sp.]
EWARASLPELPALMQESGQRASRLNSTTINTVEAALLVPLIGTTIEATVIELRGERASVQIADPAVTATASVPADVKPGDLVRLQVVNADIAAAEVEFAV